MDPSSLILDARTNSPIEFRQQGGGKAYHLAAISRLGLEVPAFVCVSAAALDSFLALHPLKQWTEAEFLSHPLPHSVREAIREALLKHGLMDCWVAVRSSGLEEDGVQHSFAGQFSSFLFQRGMESIEQSIQRCWASAHSDRIRAYRKQHQIEPANPAAIRMGVVIQKMAHCDKAGVSFSRNPIRPMDRDHLVVSSVWGLGEGLVSGELDADHYEIDRNELKITHSRIAEKAEALCHDPLGGIRRVILDVARSKASSLSHDEAKAVAQMTLELEARLGSPQDCEWGFESGRLFCLQSRPITTLPPETFFDASINGADPILWDNSNIIESYNGVTSPLTFSFASSAYRQVYIQFCEVMGVPQPLIDSRESMFRNMLGLVRGRIYYNLVNWYRLVLMLPGAGNNKAFMETMMGVRQQLKPELSRVFDSVREPVHYSLASRVRLFASTLARWRRIDSIITEFQGHFDQVYRRARATRFRELSFQALASLYQEYDEALLKKWQAPIINDYLCMVFFGLLKKLTERWLGSDAGSLQNDLLCGQGDLESTEPTKTLMRFAAWIDTDPVASQSIRPWWMERTTAQILDDLLGPAPTHPEAALRLRDFLDRFGFRCINELKLEAHDLHDDPSFVIEAITSYVRRKSYSIADMEAREHTIRTSAETETRRRLGPLRRIIYFKVLDEARKAVRNRENLRFARTKIFGVIRHLFRAMGHRLQLLGQIDAEADVFYLTTDELLAWSEGRALILDLRALIAARKKEFTEFEATPPPPDRFLTVGSATYSMSFPQVLMDADLMRPAAGAATESTDPHLLLGTPCCPGVVEGIVRVVKQASDAQGLNGEILVTERTDPGWVPLFPSCSGLLIERGSLLSHSAVVARELGLPTIVGVSGGLVKRLKSGMRVRIDAGKGEIRIL